MTMVWPVISFCLRHESIFFIVSGILLGLGFLWPILWILIFPGVALFLWTINRVANWRTAIWGGFLTWTTKALLAMAWMWTVYPIRWIDLGLGKMELPVIGFYWFTVGIFLGLGGIFVGLILWWLLKKQSSRLIFLSIPFIWLGAEMLSAFFHSLGTYGPGATIGVVFSFPTIGYLLAEHNWLLQLARGGGVFMLTIFTVFGGVILWRYVDSNKLNQPTFIKIILVGLILALSANIPGPLDSAPDQDLTVAIIDTTFGGADYFSLTNHDEYRHEQLQQAVKMAVGQKADYIILPEDSRYSDPLLPVTKAYQNFRFTHEDTKAVVIDSGSVPLENNTFTLRSVIYDGRAKDGYPIDKQFLVPQGEFMPLFYTYILKWVGLGDVSRMIETKLAYRPGSFASQAELPTYVPGILFCFASANPFGVYSLVKERAMPFVAHPISHAWFNHPVAMWHQYDTMLKIHAVWNQVPVVSAGNMVKGVVYTKDGKIIHPKIVEEGERWTVSLINL